MSNTRPDPYASEEESRAAIKPDTRTPAEKQLDAMLQERWADEQGAETGPILRQIAVELLEQLGAIGAGGVESLRTAPCLHQIQEPAPVLAVCPTVMVHAGDSKVTLHFSSEAEALEFYRTPLQAAPAGVAVPDGWKLVPVQDTPSMWTAGGHAIKSCGGHERDAASLAYKAMLAAAPALATTPAAAQEHELIDWDSAHKIAFQAAAAFRPSYFNGAGFMAHNWVVEAIRSGHIDGQRHALGLPPIDRSAAHAAELRKDRNAATPASAVPDMVSVKKEDANNYCRILAALGMEEEGDPVAEVQNLLAAAAAPVVLPEPMHREWRFAFQKAIDTMAIEADVRPDAEDQRQMRRAIAILRAMLATATGLPAQVAEQAPVLYVSKEQLDHHRDPDEPEAGRYLPCRITPAGKFTTPLFAAPQAQADARDADGMYYLQDARWSAMVGNCPSFWRLGGGYTTNLDDAERFTLEAAMKQHKCRETDLPWLCSELDKLRRPTVDCQYMPRSWDAQRESIAAIAAAKGESNASN